MKSLFEYYLEINNLNRIKFKWFKKKFSVEYLITLKEMNKIERLILSFSEINKWIYSFLTHFHPNEISLLIWIIGFIWKSSKNNFWLKTMCRNLVKNLKISMYWAITSSPFENKVFKLSKQNWWYCLKIWTCSSNEETTKSKEKTCVEISKK
jgi:hypothetical protein